MSTKDTVVSDENPNEFVPESEIAAREKARASSNPNIDVPVEVEGGEKVKTIVLQGQGPGLPFKAPRRLPVNPMELSWEMRFEIACSRIVMHIHGFFIASQFPFPASELKRTYGYLTFEWGVRLTDVLAYLIEDQFLYPLTGLDGHKLWYVTDTDWRSMTKAQQDAILGALTAYCKAKDIALDVKQETLKIRSRGSYKTPKETGQLEKTVAQYNKLQKRTSGMANKGKFKVQSSHPEEETTDPHEGESLDEFFDRVAITPEEFEAKHGTPPK